jgi:MFS family permease
VGPFLIQVTLNYSAVTYGYIALSLGLAYFIGNCINRVIINYLPPLKIFFVAMICALIITIFFVVLGWLFTLNLYVILIPVLPLFFVKGFITPNAMGRLASLFPHLAGTASAMYGLISAGGVFFITTLAATFATNTQMPLAFLYLITVLVCLTLFILAQRVEKTVTE